MDRTRNQPLVLTAIVSIVQACPASTLSSTNTGFDRKGGTLLIDQVVSYYIGEIVQLSDFVANVEYSNLPSRVTRKAKQCTRAYFVCALYGSQYDPGENIVNYVNDSMPGNQATVIGYDTSSGLGATLANGVSGMGDACDDTFSSILIHPTAPILLSALAAAEITGKGGRKLLTGYVVGVETTYRLGRSLYPSHYESWRGTSTLGTFGAAAAAASIFDFNTREAESAVGIAASSSGGLKKI